MRVLIALLLLLICFGVPLPSKHPFIVFTNDGTFYKLDPENKQVQWHNELPFKLLSLDITPQLLTQNETKKFFIPTIDGDFLYLEHSLINKIPKEILVPREDVEHLLDMCFDARPQQKYFVYQKLEYFVLNTENGQFHYLQEFLNEKKILNRSQHAVIIVSRKLLKQLSLKMEVKWSVISSKITLANVDEFVKSNKVPQHHVQHKKYSFMRIDPKTIEILDENLNIVFEIQASSSIMAIFSQEKNARTFSRITIKNAQHKMLALEQAKKQPKQHKISNDLMNAMNSPSNKFDDFPHSSHYVSKQLQLQRENEEHQNLQMCIKTHKILKQSGAINKPIIIGSDIKHEGPRFYREVDFDRNFPHDFDFNPDDLPTLPYSSDKRIKVIVTKQQPFVYIFLIAIIVSVGILFYRFKVNKLWEEMSQQKFITNENLKKITQKLGQYEHAGKELKKMYDINWNKLLYRNPLYFIFEGRFLNQISQVVVLSLNGFDIIDIEHKLNILINCSHKSIIKLYYYTRNEDSLLIFCENSNGIYKKLNEQSIQVLERLNKEDENYKNCIKVLLESIYQLMHIGIEINMLVQESILISDKMELKVNIIPSFLEKNMEEEDKKIRDMGTTRIRLELVSIIHRLGHKNQKFDLIAFEKEKNSEEEANVFLKDFYDHILLSGINEKQEDIQIIKKAEKHPFLWDSKHKMLYICDFSNYVETCIDESKIQKMEEHCRNYKIISQPWISTLHPTLAKQINSYRKYDFNSVRDLIRLTRNKLSHFHEIPKETRVYVGKSPQQFVEYILEKFPKLLSFMYVYASKKRWKLSVSH